MEHINLEDDGNVSDLEEQLRELEFHPLDDDNEEIVLEDVQNEVDYCT